MLRGRGEVMRLGVGEVCGCVTGLMGVWAWPAAPGEFCPKHRGRESYLLDQIQSLEPGHLLCAQPCTDGEGSTPGPVVHVRGGDHY